MEEISKTRWQETDVEHGATSYPQYSSSTQVDQEDDCSLHTSGQQAAWDEESPGQNGLALGEPNYQDEEVNQDNLGNQSVASEHEVDDSAKPELMPDAMHIEGTLEIPHLVTDLDSLTCGDSHKSSITNATALMSNPNLLAADQAPEFSELVARLTAQIREQLIQELGRPLVHAVAISHHHSEELQVSPTQNQDNDKQARKSFQISRRSQHTLISLCLIFASLVVIGVIVSVVVKANKASGDDPGYSTVFSTSNDAPNSFSHLPPTVATTNPSAFRIPFGLGTTYEPTNETTTSPTYIPTNTPTNLPTIAPTDKPTNSPTVRATHKPTNFPTFSPSNKPTDLPTFRPTSKPTNLPTLRPTSKPTNLPTLRPTSKPTNRPTKIPSIAPTSSYTNQDYLLDVLRPHITITNNLASLQKLEDPTTPQYKAIKWMANDDELFTSNPKKLSTSVLLERYSLAVLYYSTNGSYWKTSKNINWLTPTTVCGWNIEQSRNATLDPLVFDPEKDQERFGGVYCNSNGSVSALQTYNLGLEGNIPWELALLSNLNFLNLGLNNLSGNLPSEYSLFTNLVYFEVSENQLTGSIPAEYGSLTYLTRINFEANNLSGRLPSNLGFLTQLTSLSVASNKLTGTIHSAFSKLTNLEIAYFCDNDLKGNVNSLFCVNNMNWKTLAVNNCDQLYQIQCSCCWCCLS